MKTKAEIELALLPEGLPPVDANKWPKERAGALNVYSCDKCRGVLVVVLLDWGTTPFMLACGEGDREVVMPPGAKRDRYCKGSLQSRFYRVAPLWAAHLSHAFYRPDDTGPAMVPALELLEAKARRHKVPDDAIEAARRETIEHVERGGLLLRKLNEHERREQRRRFSTPGHGGSSHPGRFA
jgi:hypothetical protein